MRERVKGDGDGTGDGGGAGMRQFQRFNADNGDGVLVMVNGLYTSKPILRNYRTT